LPFNGHITSLALVSISLITCFDAFTHPQLSTSVKSHDVQTRFTSRDMTQSSPTRSQQRRANRSWQENGASTRAPVQRTSSIHRVGKGCPRALPETEKVSQGRRRETKKCSKGRISNVSLRILMAQNVCLARARMFKYRCHLLPRHHTLTPRLCPREKILPRGDAVHVGVGQIFTLCVRHGVHWPIARLHDRV
jgi:hypothetical protein